MSEQPYYSDESVTHHPAPAGDLRERENVERLVAEVRTGMRGYSEGDLRAVAEYLAAAVMALLGEVSL